MTATNSPSPALSSTQSFTYADLHKQIDAHLTECKRESSIPNYNTTLNIFKRVHQLVDSSPVGPELLKEFDHKLSAFVDAQVAEGIKASTYQSRCSHLRDIQSHYATVILPTLIPTTFHDALRKLIANGEYTLAGFYRLKISDICREKTFSNWYYGINVPKSRNVPVVKEIEQRLGAPEGTLTSRLPTRQYGKPGTPAGQTAFGRKSRAAMGKPYRIWTDAVGTEFAGLRKHKSAAILPEGERRSKIGRWTSSEGDILPSARVNKNYLQGFFGFCHLPEDASDPHLRGLGISKEDLSLALIADKRICEAYVEFMRCRTTLGSDSQDGDASAAGQSEGQDPLKGKYNQGMIAFLAIAMGYLHEETGYLTQHPEFAVKLGSRMTAATWQEQCRDTRTRLKEIHQNICSMKENNDYENFEKGRDPKEPIRMILDLKRPLLAVHRMLKLMLNDFEAKKDKLLSRAELYRNILLVAMLAANPLRVRQFAIMQFNKHLRREEDGSWWLHFKRGDFKNRRALQSDYSVRVAPEVWPLIERFRSEFHPALVGDRECDYVFVPRIKGRHSKANFRLRTKSINTIINVMSRSYVPDCPGFGPHAFRHIVATDIIKSNPAVGFFLAAKALHDKLDTVEREYIHLKTSEFFEPYNDHFSAAWQQIFG